ncbi:hypothetical protein KUCAC02_017138, partial [Chaenocephalus aceratus]
SSHGGVKEQAELKRTERGEQRQGSRAAIDQRAGGVRLAPGQGDLCDQDFHQGSSEEAYQHISTVTTVGVTTTVAVKRLRVDSWLQGG